MIPYLFSYVKFGSPKGAKWKVVLLVDTFVTDTMGKVEKLFQEFCEHEGISAQLISAVSTEPDFPSYYYGKGDCNKNICDEHACNEKQNVARELVWCRVDDIEKEGVEHWIPGRLNSDGTVDSALGILSDPDSPDDIRKFTDCPYKGFNITKSDEAIVNRTNMCLAEATVVIHGVGSQIKSFAYTMPVYIDMNLTHDERCCQIKEQFKKYIHCIGSVKYALEVVGYHSVTSPFEKNNFSWNAHCADDPNVRHYTFQYRYKNSYEIGSVALLCFNHYNVDLLSVVSELNKDATIFNWDTQVSDIRGMMLCLKD